MTPTETDWKRFWMKVEKTKSCWNWTGVRSPTGYGVFYFAGKTHRVHRVTMAATLGKLTPGLVVDHVCRNRACVNPSHLREVTQRENVISGLGFPGVHKRKSHCPQGHEYTKENTRIRAKGWRLCRTCHRADKNKARSRRARTRPTPPAKEEE